MFKPYLHAQRWEGAEKLGDSRTLAWEIQLLQAALNRSEVVLPQRSRTGITGHQWSLTVWRTPQVTDLQSKQLG
jgi:hypothetical protein